MMRMRQKEGESREGAMECVIMLTRSMHWEEMAFHLADR